MTKASVKVVATAARPLVDTVLASLAIFGCVMTGRPARAATDLHCTAPMSQLIVSPDSSIIAVLGACTPKIDLLPSPQLRVGPVRDGARLVSHELGRRRAFLGEFTANDRLLWFTSFEPGAERVGNTVYIYERSLTTGKDRVVTTITAPFAVGYVQYMPGTDFSLVVVDNQSAEFRSQTYIYKNEYIADVQAVGGELRPEYWSEPNKAFVCTIVADDSRNGEARLALLTADGQIHPLKDASDNSAVGAKSLSGALVQYSPNSPLAVAVFVRFEPASFGSSATGLIDTATPRDGRLGVAPTITNDTGWRPFYAAISPAGKYIALKFSKTIDVINAANQTRVLGFQQTPATQSGVFNFSNDEKNFVVTDGDVIFVRQLKK